ncbi:Putative AC transposase [Linum grandiflorum]
MCISKGMKFRRLYFDISDWNNTVYDMVDGFIHIHDVLVELCKLEPDISNCHGVLLPVLTEDEWSVLCSMRNLFEKFRAAFDILCSVYIPTTNLVVPILVTLSEVFAKYRDDNHVGRICSAMEVKFAAYWDDDGIPMVYCLATILDPRYKLDGLSKLLDAYNGNMKIQIQDRKPEIKNLLYRMYDAYSKQYVPVVREDVVRTGISTGTKTALAIAHSLRNDGEEVSSYCEINYYLSSNDLSWSFSAEDMERLEMLDVLKWWKHNESRYPVLGSMARDLLAMSSAKVPEDVFDFHSSDVNSRRREIGPGTANMCVCLKDWLRAENRMQHLFVNKEGEACSSDDEDRGYHDEGDDGNDEDDEDVGGEEDCDDEVNS